MWICQIYLYPCIFHLPVRVISLHDHPCSSSDDENDFNIFFESFSWWLYLPTPEKMVRNNPAIVPSNICFMDLTQYEASKWSVPIGCKGKLTPIRVKSVGQGGAVSISYVCNGCGSRTALLETSAKYELGDSNEVSIAAQVGRLHPCNLYWSEHLAWKQSNGKPFSQPSK